MSIIKSWVKVLGTTAYDFSIQGRDELNRTQAIIEVTMDSSYNEETPQMLKAKVFKKGKWEFIKTEGKTVTSAKLSCEMVIKGQNVPETKNIPPVPENNVVPLGGITKLDLPSEKLLEYAAENDYDGLVLMGYKKSDDPNEDGRMYFASTYADGGTVLWLLENCKLCLMSVPRED